MGDRLGRYTIRKFLGRGGMGRVYRATGPDGEVALKLVHPQFLERDDFMRRFLLESGAGKRVRHPNVVKTHGLEVIDHGGRKQAMLVMEFVPGRTLMSLQTDLGMLPDGFLRAIAEGVAAGLEAIHAAGVIHRDLKPENVLLTADHRVTIMDLGVARLSEEDARLSRTGHFVGSLLFASPEQLTDGGAACGPSTDLYATGLLLYVLATGAHPFPSGTAGEIIAAHLHTRPRPVRAVNPSISPFLAGVIEVLLEKRPDDRFASAAALLDVLQLAEASPWWRAHRDQGRAQGGPRARLDVSRDLPLRGRGDALRALVARWREVDCGQGGLVLLEGDGGAGTSRVLDAFVDMLGLDTSRMVLLEPSNVGAPLTCGAFAERIAEAPRRIDLTEACLAEGPEALLDSVVERFAAQGRGLILIDRPDQVLLDPAELLGRLARRAVDHPLLVVIGARPLEDAARVACLAAPRATVVPLPSLDRDEAYKILGDLGFTPALLEELGPRLIAVTEGSPGLLTDMVAHLETRRILRPRSEGTYELAEHGCTFEVPPASRPRLESRLRALEPDAWRRLRAAAVQGGDVDLALLARVLDESPDASTAALIELGGRSPCFRIEGTKATFSPPLLREIVCETTPPEVLRGWHAATAEALTRVHADHLPLEAARLVHHFLAAHRAAEAEPLLATALGHLVCTHEHAQIVDLVATALEHRAQLDPTLVVEAMGARAVALEALGRHAEQREAIEALRVFARDRALPMDPVVLDAWGRLRLAEGEIEHATTIFEEQLEAARAAGALRVAIRAQRSLAEIALAAGRFDEARGALERCLREARSLSDPSEVGACHAVLAKLHGLRGIRARHEGALEQQALAAEQTGDLRQRANAFGGMARRALLSGDFTAAQTHLDRQLRLARTAHARGSEVHALRGLGVLQMARGQLAMAGRTLEAASMLAERAGREQDATRLWIDRARHASMRGDPLAVMRMSMRALSRAQRLGATSVEVAALALVGDAALEREDVEEARDWYAQARRATRGGGRRDLIVAPLLGQARLARLENDREGLTLALEAARRIARETECVGLDLLAQAMGAAALDTSAEDVVRALLLHGRRLTVHQRLEIWVDLADATGDPLFGRYARDTVLALAGDLGVTPASLAASTRLYRRVPGFERAAPTHQGVAS